ncbi:phosphonatase-like hydrolase [Subtercola vilae]|uniref:Phosphonatase-like hydrolase n=2 Tax=Subtercola vilae TaxID=2056433 RepID=A0A4T2BJ03_9MICO|nr:phosphonatase-like hydrolase [Subtercola vilae]
MIELVAFDMAGTTIDDHGLVYVALADAVVETGASLADDDLQNWMGTDKVAAITALMRLGGVEPEAPRVAAAFDRFKQILGDSYRAHPPVGLPGVEELFRQLAARGVAVALTTGFSDDVAGPLLESLGWSAGSGCSHLLDAVVTTSHVVRGRPAPYLIHHAMERVGAADVSTVLAVGDTVVDLLAAHHAGVRGIGVLTGGLTRAELAEHPHHAILDSAADLLTLSALF